MSIVIINNKSNISWPRYVWDMENSKNIIINDNHEYLQKQKPYWKITRLKYGIEIITYYQYNHSLPVNGFHTYIGGIFYLNWEYFNKHYYSNNYADALATHHQQVKAVKQCYPDIVQSNLEKQRINDYIKDSQIEYERILEYKGEQSTLEAVYTSIEQKQRLINNWETETILT